jgi:GNAT superfamily N-acetyltransferase
VETNSELEQVVYGYWAKRFGCNPEDFFHSGTLIVPEEELGETGKSYLYHIDTMSILRIAPSLAKEPRQPDGYDRTIGSIMVNTLQTWIQVDVLSTLLDCYLDPKDFRCFTVGDGFTTRRLDAERDNHHLLKFYGSCTAADIDEADISIDEPDPVIYGTFDKGQLVAYASHRYWDDFIADIGVLIHPSYRCKGLGKAVVSALCEWCIENEVVPMYRVYTDHTHSRKIPKALGFKEMVDIETLELIKEDDTG